MNPAIIALVVGYVFLLGIFAYELWIRLKESNVPKASAIGTILGVALAIPTLLFVGYQVHHLEKSVTTQSDRFRMENRPYLHAVLKIRQPGQNKDEGQVWFGGGNLYLTNKGKTPASIDTSRTKYKVVSDEMDPRVMDWFESDAGGFPHVNNVFPGQKDSFVPLHPMIGHNPKVVFVGAVIAYTGTDPEKTYWYEFSQQFVIKFKKTKEGKQIFDKMMPLPADHDWDRNADFNIPELVAPDLQETLSVPYVKLWLSRD